MKTDMLCMKNLQPSIQVYGRCLNLFQNQFPYKGKIQDFISTFILFRPCNLGMK